MYFIIAFLCNFKYCNFLITAMYRKAMSKYVFLMPKLATLQAFD